MELTKNAKDISGQKYGLLTAIRPVGYNNGFIWECKCDCGGVTKVALRNLTNGHIKSCGCMWHPKGTIRNFKHGLGRTRIYKIYSGMLYRCTEEGDLTGNYYKRGIRVCNEWQGNNGAINFYNWAISSGYNDDLTLDRIDNNGDYSPDNCRWTTMLVQANNKRNNHFLEFNGEKKTISQWSRETGISGTTILARLKGGWPIVDALTIPVGSVRHYVTT